jgi:hypothetical protein
MKKLIFILIASLSIASLGYGQTVDDALRYSQVFYSGTARFNSMGGAFTALGGDLSALSQNPAGLGVFRSSELAISPQLFHFKSVADLRNNKSEDYLYNFNLGQAGIVANIINRNQESGLITLNFGYSYNRTNNFNQTISVKGTLENSSLLDYFVDESNGILKGKLSSEVPDAFLAYDTYLLDTLSGYNDLFETVYSNYGDNPPSVYGQTMRRIITSSGGTGEHALSIGGNYSNKIFFGATIGITNLNYEYRYEHMEKTSASLPSKFTDFNYMFYYNNSGTGYSVKFGAIFKPVEILRIGMSFHSPTLFHINEVVNDNMTAYFSDNSIPYKQENKASRYSYALTTPFRANLGAALQVKKLALLSADYEFVDYSTARFSDWGDDYPYGDKNAEIKNTLKAAHNFRLGAEFRLNNLYMRGGYSYYGKTFKTDQLNADLDYSALSLGIGFREQNVYADLGFTTLSNPLKYIVYDSSLETVISNLDLNRNIISVTFGYKFGY